MKTLYIPTPRRVQFIKNDDHLYNFQLMRLSDYSSDLKMVRTRSIVFDIATHSRLALSFLHRRYRLPVPRRWRWHLSQYYRLPSVDLDIMGADAILAYERYPDNAKLPVIWMTDPTDVEKLRSSGVTERDIRQEIDFKREVNEKAAATVLTTQLKKRAFDDLINPAKPTHVIPFFQPLESISPSQFAEKWHDAPPRTILYLLRREDQRALPLLLAAFAILQKCYAGRVSLHILSDYSRGCLPHPKLPGLIEEKAVSHQRLMDLVRDAHYLLLSSESNDNSGPLTAAMAQGTIPILTSEAVHNELVDGVIAGLFVERNAEAIAEAISLGIEKPDSARQMASRAMDMWQAKYACHVVAGKLAALAYSHTTRTADPVWTSAPLLESDLG